MEIVNEALKSSKFEGDAQANSSIEQDSKSTTKQHNDDIVESASEQQLNAASNENNEESNVGFLRRLFHIKRTKK